MGLLLVVPYMSAGVERNGPGAPPRRRALRACLQQWLQESRPLFCIVLRPHGGKIETGGFYWIALTTSKEYQLGERPASRAPTMAAVGGKLKKGVLAIMVITTPVAMMVPFISIRRDLRDVAM